MWSEQTHNPQVLVLVLGDFNKANLRQELPKYRQVIKCLTREDNILLRHSKQCLRLWEDSCIPSCTRVSYNDKSWFTAKEAKARKEGSVSELRQRLFQVIKVKV